MKKEPWFKKIGGLFVSLLLVSLLLVFLGRKSWFLRLEGWLNRPVALLEQKTLISWENLNSGFKNLGANQGQEKQIFLLEGKLRQLAVEQNQLSLCQEENEKIKKMLGASLPASWQFMEAKVIGLNEKMKIDKGEREGIKTGMNVLSENILLGRIETVQEHQSLIQMVYQPNLKIPVVVKRANQAGVQARGLLIGQYKNKMILDRVLQGEDLQKGDIVVTSGEEGWLPDLVIGQIEEVIPKSAEVYQKATVSPLIDYQKLRIVFLVVK
ncbi:MAG: rod shape-determining protein MreC [Candidatus Shapirobacteria bacterium]|nr:rod shape-determining protein MreC [Candidatus Shapirobacteria bacterium]